MLTRMIIAAAAMLTAAAAASAGGLTGAALPQRPYDQLSAGELKAAGLPAKLSPAFAAALNNPRATPDKAVLQPMGLKVPITLGPLNLVQATNVQGQFLSSNWSGQLLPGGGQPESTSTVAVANPPVLPPGIIINPVPDGYYCPWVGTDGFGSGDLPLWQTGYCGTSGSAFGPTQTVAWLECYPQDPSIVTLFPVSVGDTMFYTVWSVSPGVAAVYIQDMTTGTYYSNSNYSCSPPGNSSETIVENPGSNTNQLADYGTLAVSGAQNVTSGVGFGDPSATQIIMVDLQVSTQQGHPELSVPTVVDDTDILFQYVVNGPPPPPCDTCQPPPPCDTCQPPPPPVPPTPPVPPRPPRPPVRR